jgi:hypothetical protein
MDEPFICKGCGLAKQKRCISEPCKKAVSEGFCHKECMENYFKEKEFILKRATL